MYRYLPLFFIFFILSCGHSPLDMSEEEIDAYVEECTDPLKVYDIKESMRFSKNDEAYEVTEYSTNDSVILFNTEETWNTKSMIRNYYFKDGYPVYVEDFLWEYPEAFYKVTERKIYLTGDDVLVAYERTSDTDEGIETAKFQEMTLDFESLDIDRPKNAVEQQGDYEMKFGEFLIINPDSYLILDNEKSGYGVALYIIEGDELLDELYENPDTYQGKTVIARHEFMSMNGIERQIYRGGQIK